MSTPEQPATPALTRKQLRDIRNTGATPIISADAPATADDEPISEATPDAADVPAEPVDPDDASDPEPDAPVVEAPVVAAPLPRAALPVAVHDLPGADASVDLGVAPLTRRQARQQERIRTASVPVITPEVAAAHTPRAEAEPAPDLIDDVPVASADDTAPDEIAALIGLADESDDHSEGDSASEVLVESAEPRTDHEPVAAADEVDVHKQDDTVADDADDAVDEGDRAIVHPQFGAELLAGESAPVELPPSFDQLITRSVTGAIGTGNALILSQTPSAPPLVAPVTATGEVLITGSFNLPEGLGSTGHATGTADGKEVDAVLVDGELPAHSSPTPIAASAAISTVKNGGDIIKPPTPEKGGRLMLTLAITAGVLALALVGVLILAVVTGVF